jgi:ADP-ribose pyrophosphatase YjhB (NUDIX family)
VSGVLIENDRVLLIAHRKDGKIYWLLPGGGVDYGESLREALGREFREELGISVDVEDVAFLCDSIAPEEERHIIHIVFHCTYASGTYALGPEKRLFNFSFFAADQLRDLMIFPPMRDEIEQLLGGGKTTSLYYKKEWMPL